MSRIEQSGRMSLRRTKPPIKGGSAPEEEEEEEEIIRNLRKTIGNTSKINLHA